MLIAAMSRSRIGRIQLGVRRSFIISGGQAVPFSELAVRCYPRLQKLALKQRWSIYRALKIYGVPVRRGWWAPSPTLQAWLHRDKVAKR